MIQDTNQRIKSNNGTHFVTSAEPDMPNSHFIDNGISNVQLEHTKVGWFDYLQSTLGILDKISKLGFSLNCLTSYSDVEKK